MQELGFASVYTSLNMSQKRPAASVLASTRRSKKPKVFKKQQLTQLIADVIESVGSQNSKMSHQADSDNDEADEADVNGNEATNLEATGTTSDSMKSLNDSLTQDAINVCKNMHAEYAKLTNVIKQQHAKINGLEKQLDSIITLLQKVNDSCTHQRQQLSQQQEHISGLENQLVTILSLSESTNSAQQNHSQHNQLLVVESDGSSATAVSATRNAMRVDNGGGQRGTGRCPGRSAGGRGGDRAAGNAERSVTNVDTDNADEHFTMIVHRTLGDMSRRKRNVVVTGLPEEAETGVEDVATFLETCAAYLPVKPRLADGNNCCTRIGKSSSGRPRRLLVRLHSEEAANDLLQAAPSLRYASDDYIRTSIFINADLSPSAAKLAYEARKRRRDNLRRFTVAAAASEEMDTGNISMNADLQHESRWTERSMPINSHTSSSGSASAATDYHAVTSPPPSLMPAALSTGDTLSLNVMSQKISSTEVTVLTTANEVAPSPFL